MIDVAYALAGAFTGFVVGLTGVGGGALMTPILLIFFGVSPTTAIATDLWFAAITKLVGARVHHANGNVDWQVAKRLWLGSLPIALLIVVTVSLGTQVAKVDWLTKAIGILVLVTAIGLLVSTRHTGVCTRPAHWAARAFYRCSAGAHSDVGWRVGTVCSADIGWSRRAGQRDAALSVPTADDAASAGGDRYRACNSLGGDCRARLSVRGHGGLVDAGQFVGGLCSCRTTWKLASREHPE